MQEILTGLMWLRIGFWIPAFAGTTDRRALPEEEREMKRGLLGLLVIMLMLAMGTQAYAAAGYRSGIVLYPYEGYSNSDSTWATTVGDGANWFDWRAYAAGHKANGMGVAVTVKTADADVDSIMVVFAGSADKKNLVAFDSSEITGSTAGSGMVKVYTTSDTYGYYPYRIVYARVWGDAAGSATQTITLTVSVWWYNTLSATFVNYKQYDIDVSFAE